MLTPSTPRRRFLLPGTAALALTLAGAPNLSASAQSTTACVASLVVTADDSTKPAADAPPPPLLDENGRPFPPPRPVAPAFQPEISASRFAELAMADTMLEIALGELVKRKGESQAVKDLAHRLVTNHTAIKLILSRAATGTLESFPPIDAQAQATLDRLALLSGAELDREYLWEQSLRQPRQLAMYRWQYENCDAKLLRQFAVGTMPIIAVHARVADEVHRKVNADEIALQERRAEAERKAEQARKQAEAEAAARKPPRKFKK